ncbi:MAG: PTS glucitol/sorbitol transporter subunit IIA [Selenomonadaceae bacterium]|nr:PTS glucitol/sorbitol transporter subunit IIA [Selenomonadaceae bacterium]
MEIKYEVKTSAVGKFAQQFLENNNSFILMNEGSHPNLADMVVSHTIGELSADIAVGDMLRVGRTELEVVKVGDAANKNIREEGHCTVVVNADGSMPGQIVVKGKISPRLRIGNEIVFYSK